MVKKNLKEKPAKDLAKQTISELKKLQEEGRTELFHLKMDLKAGRLKDVSQIRKKRKEIARIKTFIRIKQLEGRE